MRRRSHHGFSLIELLIVVSIIMVLSAVAVPNLLRVRQNAYEASAVGFLRTLQAAQIAYRSSNGVYAGSFDVLPEVWVNTTATSTANSGTAPGNQGQGHGNQAQGQGNQGQGNQGHGQGNQGNSGQGQGQNTSGGSSSGSSSATVLVRSNYIFALTTANAEQWHCTAEPTLDRSTGRYFYTDETGTTHVQIGANASAGSPVVQ
jgi:prepilin-type N-terminal cleavage/methylation domain-containing protein